MTSFDKEDRRPLKWIPVRQLSVVWAEAQRPLDNRHVQRIHDSFDPDKFGELSVTKPNGAGIYHLIDGQHRRAAIEKLYGPDEQVPCREHDDTDPRRAAEIFLGINAPQNRKAVSAISRFLIAVKAGHTDEVEVNKIVRANGYRVSYDGGVPDSIRCVGALLYAFRRCGGQALSASLAIIHATWGEDSLAVSGPIVSGYVELIVEHGSKVNLTRLKDCMEKMTPAKLLANAKNLAESLDLSLSGGVRLVLLRHYNKKLGKEKQLKTKGEV